MTKAEQDSSDLVDAIAKRRLNIRDWLVIVLSLVSMVSSIGTYKVYTYRIEQLESSHNKMIEHMKEVDTAIGHLPGMESTILTRGDLLKAQSTAITDLQMFKATQEVLNNEMRNHTKDMSIHVTSEHQQVTIMQALSPLAEQITRLSVQLDDRQKQWDRIEHALQQPSPKQDH